MNILQFHDQLIYNYKSYIQSFLNIKDEKIKHFVDAEISSKKLWPEPLIQFNPTFERGKSFQELKGSLHPIMPKIFSNYKSLHRHQQEAIELGIQGREFIVTSGTGSGKSLTYIATIFNHVLKGGNDFKNKCQAIIVYPMNALINSQSNAIETLKKQYETQENEFPILVGQFTGQEDEDAKANLRRNPPHILLTNYMMLELIMTRGGEDIGLRNNFLDNLKYLVFDELHTYRGRQGSDVALLIRRIKALARNPVACIGTSATMVSSDATTLLKQRMEVAKVGSLIFGTDIKADQVVNEYLVRSLSENVLVSSDQLKDSINKPIELSWSSEKFEKFPTANWLEENIALEKKEGIYVRRKPVTISEIAKQLSEVSGETKDTCKAHIVGLLNWANILNLQENKSKNFLPYKLHQFIAQTGSVYSTLGDQESRTLTMDAGLYSETEKTFIFPLVFSRSSGHEFYCVNLDDNSSKILPREFLDVEEIDEEDRVTSSGYIFIQHEKDEEVMWDFDRDSDDLPESWFNPTRKDGTRSVKSDSIYKIPRKIFFDKDGSYSFRDKKSFEGWFISHPLAFDPTSGEIFDARTGEWAKLLKLGAEGRSTATTILSFETITLLESFGESGGKRKLLSFTDNRQDASLQAGHFNDFIKVGQLRAAITKALQKYNALDYSNISEKVFECLNIPQDQYAKNPASFPGPRKENEDTFKDFILYRVLHDLRRSWRVILPNLEQCALLHIDYKHVDESVQDNSLWVSNQLLNQMTVAERKAFLVQVFDFFRKAYALHFSMLEFSAINQNAKRIREKLKEPWTIEQHDKLEYPAFLRIETLGKVSSNIYAEKGGYQSALGRYIKNVARSFGLPLKGKEVYNQFVYDLFNLLSEGGWLYKKSAISEKGENVFVYQLKVDSILWKRGDGETTTQDLVKNRSYRELNNKVNRYFQKFYQIDFNAMKAIEGREHTGQINSDKRQQREIQFRAGNIAALFCSPTMELGIDISDLSVVHMRNVPPSPANYAQRSGRAGRSGQAALILVYCSNRNAHDRHYFENPKDMVAGVVTAPRIDLLNRELLTSHLHASILTKKSISALSSSIGHVINYENLDLLLLREQVAEAITLTPEIKKDVFTAFLKVISDTYFKEELSKRKPAWFTDDWIASSIASYQTEFNNAFNRWRKLYVVAQNQIRTATAVIENRIYADNHEKKIEAYRSLNQGERQRDKLLNESTEVKGSSSKNRDQMEFSPFRYLAAEGFLPGYGFTRLPIRSILESKEGSCDFISRPRSIALREFGPGNIVYHDGCKYRIDRIMLTETEAKLEKVKISPFTGYILMKDQYTYNVDPLVNEELTHGMDKYIHTDLVEMPETRAFELQRITCQEEERRRRGYDIRTYFSVEGGFETISEAKVGLGSEKLLHIHAIPAARLVHINFKWNGASENGYSLNLKSGWFQNNSNLPNTVNSDDIRRIKLYTTTTANALYIQPVKALALDGGGDGVITLMYALKRGIENYFQVESSEIGATIMGDSDTPNILLYEAAEGTLGILSQIVDTPSIYKAVMEEAFNFCFIRDGKEISKADTVPATYSDLLSYYNQWHHQHINRNFVRESLRMLKDSTVEVLTSKSFNSYDEQYFALQAARDPLSSTEDAFLKYLYENGIRLPDEAQPKILNLYVKPDFLYKPNVCVFCDGAPHDLDDVKADDHEKRKVLKDAGYQVLVWHYSESLNSFIAKRPDIFKPIKSDKRRKIDVDEFYLRAKEKYGTVLEKLSK